MNLSRKRVIAVLTAVVITTAWPTTIFAEEDLSVYTDAQLIAMTMREYQARWVYCRGGINWDPAYVPWDAPDACNTLDTPPFPCDDWYGYTVQQDSTKADRVDLVKCILGKFKSYPFEPHTAWGIFRSFTHRDFEDLDGMPTYIGEPGEGMDTPYKYVDTDFPELRNEDNTQWLTVTSSNYRDVLEKLYAAITEKLIILELASTVTSQEWRDGRGDELTCAESISGADTQWLNDTWHSDSREVVGIKESSAIEYKEGPGAQKKAVRGKLKCDKLSDHTGKALSYITIAPESHGFSNTGDDLEARETWQLWPKQFIDAGSPQGWTSSGYLANFEPEVTSDCPDHICYRGWVLQRHILLLKPDFDTDPEGIVLEDTPPDVKVYKDDTLPPHVIYSAPPTKCGNFASGETVDGIVTPSVDPDAVVVRLIGEYDTTAAELSIEGTALTDPDKYLCVQGISTTEPLDFKVRALKGTTEVVFKVIFWRETGTSQNTTLHHSEAIVAVSVEPSSGSPCCRASDKDEGEGPCPLAHIVAGLAEETIECGKQPEPEKLAVKVHANDDVEVQLPGYEEPYIMKTPGPGFLSGITVDVTEDGGEVVITDIAAGRQYHYTIPSGDTELRLTSICDCASPDPNPLVIFEYLSDGRIDKQKDATDNNYYIQYNYDQNGYLNELIAYAPSPNVSRTYTIYTDANGRVIGTSDSDSGGGCTECSGSNYEYSFNSDNKIQRVKTVVRDQDGNVISETVIYEYTYDSNGDFAGKWLGEASSGVPIRTVERKTVGDCEVVDTYTYSDTSTVQVEREYRNSAGLITQRETFANTGEDPDNPEGEVFKEVTVYAYSPATNTLTQKTTIPPLGDVSGNGLRREYDYDEDTGALEQERWYDSAGNEIIVRTLTYNNYPPTGEVVHVRVATETDARGATTTYSYMADSPLVDYKLMPQVIGGLTGAKRLKYSYTYDSENRVEQEKTYDYVDEQDETLLTTTIYDYDDFGNIEKQTITDGSTSLITHYIYNGFNQQILMKSPEGVVSGKAYDSSGRLVSEFVLANPSDIDFDDFDYATDYEDKITNATPANRFLLFSQTRYYYGTTGNERDRLQYVKKAKKDSTFYYILATDTDPNWVVTEYEYDQYGRRTAVIEDQTGAALKTTYEYDYQGRVKKTTLPNGKWTETYRDGRGLVKMQIVGHDNMDQDDWLVTLFYYDARGNLIEKVAPDGVSTVYKYDDFDRLVMVRKGL